jgi:hypothetical protein
LFLVVLPVKKERVTTEDEHGQDAAERTQAIEYSYHFRFTGEEGWEEEKKENLIKENEKKENIIKEKQK